MHLSSWKIFKIINLNIKLEQNCRCADDQFLIILYKNLDEMNNFMENKSNSRRLNKIKTFRDI